MRDRRIFYFCYSHNNPTGGQKHTYRHVDILNKHGFDAAVFHPGAAFRLTWFENDTCVITFSEFAERVDPARDYVVLPEDLGARIVEFPGRKVIFNKNIFHGFRCFDTDETILYPYLSSEVVAAFTVSEHNRVHLQFAYPHLHVERVYPEIRPDVFAYRPLDAKRAQIACLPKNPESLAVLYHTIQSRAAAGLNHGKSFHWEFLGGRSERETAQILQDSLLFIFLSDAEGLGRMPLEAMSCGCLVATYDCGPLQETIPAGARFRHNDITSLAAYVENVMGSFPDNLGRWAATVEAGCRSAQSFSLERQEQDLLAAWERIFQNEKDEPTVQCGLERV